MSHARSLALERDGRRLARVDDASRYPETRHDDARANAIPTRRERRTNERTNEGSPGRHVHRDRAARVGDGDEGARARGLETEGRARESRGANERCGRESASGEDAIVDRRRLFVGRRERAGARAGADGRGRGEGEGRDADGDADGETARGKGTAGTASSTASARRRGVGRVRCVGVDVFSGSKAHGRRGGVSGGRMSDGAE